MNVPIINTNQIPHIVQYLKHAFPSVLTTQCFNDQNLPFSQEVKDTEIGHLFEHILLEELCLLKIQRGSRCATFNGITNWNWVKEPQGTFHIEIDSTYKDADILVEALDKTLKLVEIIIPQNIPQKKKHPLPANAMYLQNIETNQDYFTQY